eukprot:TRINITY_DN13743_c0_g1_i1.p1 TRINITY_DN13743_c0_g1~~TRINITY_DN13743_c0_g1_i1.p1  ORF type:complete len:355 (-),score=45.37 TRINITY_DN13743_c0_g1_i1:121-1185(-)
MGVYRGPFGEIPQRSVTSPTALVTEEAVTPSGCKFVDYRPSDAWPLVLSAPHGGDVSPEAIIDRSTGCFEEDWRTLELSEAVLDAFSAAAGDRGPPAFVGLKLHRRKLDANRPRGDSCEPGAELAAQAWDSYHGSVESALSRCVERFGFCLLLDLHGQSHRDVTELGYLVTTEHLLATDSELDMNPPSRGTSMDALIRRLEGHDQQGAGEQHRLSELVRGPSSLGALLLAHGCPCTPSPEIPRPVEADVLVSARAAAPPTCAVTGPPSGPSRCATYFSGGYTTRRYGAPWSVSAGFNPLSPEAQESWAAHVSVVQLETCWVGVRENEVARRHFAKSLQEVTEAFLLKWYAWSRL